MRDSLLESFKDPSTLVRQSAIESAASLGDPALIEEIAAMAQAKETSLWKEANRALLSLAETGHKDQVLTAINKRIEATNDQARRERLARLANELK